jgi:peptidoglycan/LPS O-acetylase OafA/YrhL
MLSNLFKMADVSMKNSGASGPTAAVHKQFGLINVLKAGAAQLIVLHHLAFYGPMTDHARPLMPSLIDWLGDYGRIAVQVFLVIGGFLAAKSLSPHARPGMDSPIATIWRRYIKLAPPFIVAMLLAMLASEVARRWMNHDSISPPADASQFVAHVLLLHGVLGFDSLSAGAWYVAIDFQLYALLTLLLWASGRFAGARRLPWLMPAVVGLATSISLFYFNREADWDVWAPYFFGSYGLGILAWWASDPRRAFGGVLAILLMMVVPTVLALELDFRSRIATAAVVACVLFLYGRTRLASCSSLGWSAVNYMAKISYSVFLVHFPVCLVVNAVFTRFVVEQAQWQALGAVMAWMASLVVGAGFCRWVEIPLGRLLADFVKPGVSHTMRAKAAQLRS